MAKPTIKLNPVINLIHEDLSKFKEFCCDYGYKFNEADLNNMRSYAFQQQSKFANGKQAKNMWEIDAERLNCNI